MKILAEDGLGVDVDAENSVRLGSTEAARQKQREQRAVSGQAGAITPFRTSGRKPSPFDQRIRRTTLRREETTTTPLRTCFRRNSLAQDTGARNYNQDLHSNLHASFTLHWYPSWHTMQVSPVSSSRPIISDIHAGVAAALAAAAAVAFALALAAAELPAVPPPLPLPPLTAGAAAAVAPADDGEPEPASPAAAASLSDCCVRVVSSTPRMT